jgi:hypothetical protein
MDKLHCVPGRYNSRAGMVLLLFHGRASALAVDVKIRDVCCSADVYRVHSLPVVISATNRRPPSVCSSAADRR